MTTDAILHCELNSPFGVLVTSNRAAGNAWFYTSSRVGVEGGSLPAMLACSSCLGASGEGGAQSAVLACWSLLRAFAHSPVALLTVVALHQWRVLELHAEVALQSKLGTLSEVTCIKF